jgi:hypothetical protein
LNFKRYAAGYPKGPGKLGKALGLLRRFLFLGGKPMVIKIDEILGHWVDGKIKGIGCGTDEDDKRVNQKDLILNATVEEAENNGEAFYYCDFCGKRLIFCGDERY